MRPCFDYKTWADKTYGLEVERKGDMSDLDCKNVGRNYIRAGGGEGR